MREFLAGYVTVALLSLLVGCKQQDTTGPGNGSGTGTIQIRMTDIPAAYDSVVIVVDSVRVHIDSADSIGGWYTVSRMPSSYDLLQFTGGRDTIIAEGDVPAGYYSQVRLYIGTGSHVVVDGIPLPLEIPSGSQSGLKLNIQANIAAGVMYTVAMDFNASQSIVVTGNGRHILKPVIKIVSTAISGSLSGVVAPAATNPTVWAITGSDSSSTDTDTTGYFRFKYLQPATYSLSIVPSDTTYRDTTINGVTVTAAMNTEVGTITLHKK